MAQKIGFQDGLDWFVSFLRKFPLIKYRPVSERPVALEQWYGLEKLERTLRILKDDHDAAIMSPAPVPDPTPTPPPTTGPVAPRTYQAAPGGEPSARFCTTGLPRNANGELYDIYSEYDDDGRDKGGRTQFQAGLKPSNEMDGRSPCEADGIGHPPWPPESYVR